MTMHFKYYSFVKCRFMHVLNWEVNGVYGNMHVFTTIKDFTGYTQCLHLPNILRIKSFNRPLAQRNEGNLPAVRDVPLTFNGLWETVRILNVKWAHHTLQPTQKPVQL